MCFQHTQPDAPARPGQNNHATVHAAISGYPLYFLQHSKMTKKLLSIPIYLFRFMRWTFIVLFFILTALLTAKAGKSSAQVNLETKVTLDLQNATFKTALQALSLKARVDFAYNIKYTPLSERVSLKAESETLSSVLSKLIKPLGLTYRIIGNSILIEREKKEGSAQPSTDAPVVPQSNEAKPKVLLHGHIIDEDGKPLVGANVFAVNESKAASTNQNGDFYLPNVDPDALLRISYIGYQAKEIKGSEDLSAIRLLRNQSKLDEVKVIAYGTTTERLSTGSVSTLTAADIEKQPVSNILDALSGRVAGMQITPSSGLPGAAPAVLIRGRSSLGNASNTPLFILDGIPIPATQNLTFGQALDNGALNLLLGINPEDIESVSVLKDADATSIYGSRGANGVVLITTKRGSYTGTKVNVNAYTGTEKVGHFIDMLNVHQYNAMRKEAFGNDKIAITPSNAVDLYWDSTSTHNWQKELIGKTAITQDANVSVNGGSATTHFYFSSAYHKEGSVMPGNSELKRGSFLASFNHVSTDRKFSFDAQTGYTVTQLNLLPIDQTSKINLAPDYPLYNADGSPSWTGPAGFPLANTLQQFSSPTKTFSGSTIVAYELIKGLKIKTSAGYNNIAINQSTESPLASLDPRYYTTGTLNVQNINTNNWIVEPQAEYEKKLGKSHLDILGGATFQKNSANLLTLQASGFANDALVGNVGSASTVSVSSVQTPYSYESIYGRATYNYGEEYLANITYRRDGSSRFGDGRKFANFGALGLGWIFTKEHWLEKVLPVLSYGKIRASYGVSGNDQIPDFAYIATESSLSGSQAYNSSPALTASNIQNPDYRWEINKKLEAALELGFLNDRIFLSASLYRNSSGNQLINYLISPQTGFTYYVSNFPAKVVNRGFELELNSHNLTGQFTWNTSLNLTKASNTLKSYPNLATSSYSSLYVVGQSLNLIKAYQFNGLSNTGGPVFTDLNNDKVVTNKDQVVDGNKDPYYGGMGNDFSYKGFTASFFIQYTRYRGALAYLPNGIPGTLDQNFSTYVLGRWRTPGDEAKTSIPRYTTNAGLYSSLNYNASTAAIGDRDVFRLSNASLGYTIPEKLTKHIGFSRLQFYIRGQNLYTFDKYSKWELDPITGNSTLPALRTIVFGFNATL